MIAVKKDLDCANNSLVCTTWVRAVARAPSAKMHNLRYFLEMRAGGGGIVVRARSYSARLWINLDAVLIN